MKERYSKTTKDILLGLAVVGAVAIASTSPYFSLNLIKALKKDKKYIKKYFEKKRVDRAFAKLRKNRLVILQEKQDGKFIVRLTEKGKRKVKEIQYDNLKIEKPDVWDGRWRVVIFDIPEKKKLARNTLTQKFKELKFYPFQKSVWVCPYPCEKEVQFLVELFEIGPYVNIIIAKEISNDVKLKKYFKFL